MATDTCRSVYKNAGNFRNSLWFHEMDQGLPRRKGVATSPSLTLDKLGFHQPFCQAPEYIGGKLLGSVGYTSYEHQVISPAGPPRSKFGYLPFAPLQYSMSLTARDLEYVKSFDEQGDASWKAWKEKKAQQAQTAKYPKPLTLDQVKEAQVEHQRKATQKFREWRQTKKHLQRREADFLKLQHFQLREFQLLRERSRRDYEQRVRGRESTFSLRCQPPQLPPSFDGYRDNYDVTLQMHQAAEDDDGDDTGDEGDGKGNGSVEGRFGTMGDEHAIGLDGEGTLKEGKGELGSQVDNLLRQYDVKLQQREMLLQQQRLLQEHYRKEASEQLKGGGGNEEGNEEGGAPRGPGGDFDFFQSIGNNQGLAGVTGSFPGFQSGGSSDARPSNLHPAAASIPILCDSTNDGGNNGGPTVNLRATVDSNFGGGGGMPTGEPNTSSSAAAKVRKSSLTAFYKGFLAPPQQQQNRSQQNPIGRPQYQYQFYQHPPPAASQYQFPGEGGAGSGTKHGEKDREREQRQRSGLQSVPGSGRGGPVPLRNIVAVPGSNLSGGLQPSYEPLFPSVAAAAAQAAAAGSTSGSPQPLRSGRSHLLQQVSTGSRSSASRPTPVGDNGAQFRPPRLPLAETLRQGSNNSRERPTAKEDGAVTPPSLEAADRLQGSGGAAGETTGRSGGLSSIRKQSPAVDAPTPSKTWDSHRLAPFSTSRSSSQRGGGDDGDGDGCLVLPPIRHDAASSSRSPGSKSNGFASLAMATEASAASGRSVLTQSSVAASASPKPSSSGVAWAGGAEVAVEP